MTFGTNMLASDTFGQKLVQGLVVATAGGAVSALAGGSFELAFITAGVAFAANELATTVVDKMVEQQRNKIAKSMEDMTGEDWSTESEVRNLKGLSKCNLAVDEALDNTAGVNSPTNPEYGERCSPTAAQWADPANDDFFNEQGWSDVFQNDQIDPVPGDVLSNGGHMGIYAGVVRPEFPRHFPVS